MNARARDSLRSVPLREHRRLTFTTWHPADGMHRAISVDSFATHAFLEAGKVGGRNEECIIGLTSVQTLIERVSFVKTRFPLGDLHPRW
jgi:hypothetical protein